MPIDSKKQGRSGDSSERNTDRKTDPKTLKPQAALEAEPGSDGQTLEMAFHEYDVDLPGGGDAYDDIVCDQVEDRPLPDETKNSHSTTTDTHDPVSSLTKRTILAYCSCVILPLQLTWNRAT